RLGGCKKGRGQGKKQQNEGESCVHWGARPDWHSFRTLEGGLTKNFTANSDFLSLALGRHERIAIVARRDERLLDRPRRDPADQVPHRAGLVVRPGGACASEGLLADDGARRLVVDVEVAGR